MMWLAAGRAPAGGRVGFGVGYSTGDGSNLREEFWM